MVETKIIKHGDLTEYQDYYRTPTKNKCFQCSSLLDKIHITTRTIERPDKSWLHHYDWCGDFYLECPDCKSIIADTEEIPFIEEGRNYSITTYKLPSSLD